MDPAAEAALAGKAWEETVTSEGAVLGEAASAEVAPVADFKVAVSAAVKVPAEASGLPAYRPEVAPLHPEIARVPGPMEDPIFSHNRSRMTVGLRYSSILSKPLG